MSICPLKLKDFDKFDANHGKSIIVGRPPRLGLCPQLSWGAASASVDVGRYSPLRIPRCGTLQASPLPCPPYFLARLLFVTHFAPYFLARLLFVTRFPPYFIARLLFVTSFGHTSLSHDFFQVLHPALSTQFEDLSFLAA